MLKSLWSRVSAHTDYQASLCDFEWSEDHITVSPFHGSTVYIYIINLVLKFTCPFQAIFQHLFNCTMSHLAEQITTELCFAIEFEDRGPRRYMTVRYWEGQNLHRVLICRSQLPATDLTGELGSLSRLLSAVSTKADIVACSESSVDLLRTVDYSPLFCRAVQSCFRFDQLDLPKVMHKTSYSVFGYIDFFSVLRGLVISLGGSYSEDWYQRSPELAQVNNIHLSRVTHILSEMLTKEGELLLVARFKIVIFFLRPFPVASWSSLQYRPFVRS